ncbi:flagellar basal body-associated FliL family protein [Henriciella aquimarina]|uniref:flagellar basal body-associated FliL family protein n=1 Tax=Henriciella aquimarina TaxID=545261 RepID=UPI0009FD7BC9|nr:flagellar basal body-associated FliL family protein [Henriciella aquimarina]
MKQLFPALIAALFIAIGGAGGYFLKSMMSAPSSSASASDHAAAADGGSHDGEKSGGHGEAEKKAEKKDSHGGGGDSASGEYSYYKFTREFVVPMIENDRVKSLVILNINLEVDTAVEQELFSKEPVLRDNIMTTLIKLSNDGKTFESLSRVENYETLRSMILSNLREEVEEGIHNVLILDMARQDL